MKFAVGYRLEVRRRVKRQLLGAAGSADRRQLTPDDVVDLENLGLAGVDPRI
jgi:hypothetical protein